MFERFTDRARKVLAIANQEAQRLNHEYIGTEHMLLALVKEGSGAGATVLKNLGVNLPILRAEIDKLVASGPHPPTAGKLPQTPRAKMAVTYAIEEARALNHNYVGTEHLLLGLLRESDGIAAQVLMNLGLKLEDVRQAVLNLLGGRADDAGTPPTDERLTNPAEDALELANQEAQRFNYEYVGTEHVLLGLVKEGRGLAATALANRGIDLQKLRLELDALVKSGPETVTPVQLPQTPRLRDAMTRAADEAQREDRAFVNSGHILLGLLHESAGLAAQMLFKLGMTRDAIRQELSTLAAAGVDDKSERSMSDIWEAAGASGRTEEAAAPEPSPGGQPGAGASTTPPATGERPGVGRAEDLVAWRKADELARKIYEVTGRFPKEELWGIASELRKAALPIPPGITEAYRRRNKVEVRWFLNAVLTSLAQVRYLLNLSLGLGHVKNEDCAALKQLADDLDSRLHTIHQSLGS